MSLKRSLAFAGLCIALAGCFGSDKTVQVGGPADKEGDILETRSFKTVMKTGKVLVDPEHGEETGFWYGALTGIDGTNANGVAFTHRFKDGVFITTANLNIAKLEKGSYVAWIAKDTEGTGIKRMGVLQNLLGDVRHSLRYQTSEDLSAHTVILITKEDTAVPATAGKTLVVGTLKEVQQ